MNVKLKKIEELLKEMAATIADLAESEEKVEETKKVDETVEEVKKTEEAKYTLEDVRKALAEKSGAGFTSEVRVLLQKHGASKLSGIKESDYPVIMEEVQTIGGTQ